MIYEIFVIVLIIFALWAFGRFLMIYDFVHVPKKRNHIWRHVKHLNQAAYCSICEIMLTSSGFYCECCGVCSDTHCIKTADKGLKCKDKFSETPTESNGTETQTHLWVKGNLSTENRECCVCHRDIDYHAKPGLYGYRCCWCQRATHTQCFVRTANDKICDFGVLKNMIIAPRYLSLQTHRLQNIINVKNLDDRPDWRPLIVFTNLKSGDNTGADVAAVFRNVLNPIQIFELTSAGPDEALNLMSKLSPVQCRVLVAGGDGTIGWILNAMLKKDLKPIPEVAILPIGTGNDLSRVLGWGGVPPSNLNPIDLCQKISSALPVQLDRWLVDIQGIPPKRLPNISKWLPHHKIFMYNYFSIGVDAQVTLNFHKARESPFYMLSSRVFNKLLYLCFGTHQVVLPDCVGLETKVDLYLDDVKIDLPELQAIVCINIDSWGAGVHLWQMSGDQNNETPQSISDGSIEVLGIVSSFHMAQLQVGLNKPIRLGQAKHIRMVMKESLPVQADGEPWIQSACQVDISQQGQAKMLKCLN